MRVRVLSMQPGEKARAYRIRVDFDGTIAETALIIEDLGNTRSVRYEDVRFDRLNFQHVAFTRSLADFIFRYEDGFHPELPFELMDQGTLLSNAPLSTEQMDAANRRIPKLSPLRDHPETRTPTEVAHAAEWPLPDEDRRVIAKLISSNRAVAYMLGAFVIMTIAGLWLLEHIGTNLSNLESGVRSMQSAIKDAADGIRSSTGDDLEHYGSLMLSADAASIGTGRYWVSPRLRIENKSKKVLRPLVVTWWVALPPAKGSTTPVVHKSWNSVDFAEIGPRQEVEIGEPVVVETNDKAAVVHVDVIFKDAHKSEECIFDPKANLAVDVVKLKTQPKVCIRDPRSESPSCRAKETDCETESAEKLVILH